MSKLLFMLKRFSRICACTLAVIIAVASLNAINVYAEEGTTSRDELDNLNAGITNLIDATAYNSEQSKEAKEDIENRASQVEEEVPEEESTFFMANVTYTMNVREEPDGDSKRVGYLYKDCGGQILERGDEWTKIESGDLVGWASNEYLLFDEDAEELALSVGYKIINVKTDALRVRMEPDTNAGVLGLVADGDDLEVIDDSDPEWVKVNFDGDEGYVAAEYVNITFSVDSGETLEAIEAREEAKRKEEEKKAAESKKLTTKQSAVIANADESRLLAALIQCEAGTVDYEGCLAVGAVVMNRVRSGAYPATITDVIYASGQFSPARNGRLTAAYNGNISSVCVQAAQAALAGETNVGTATHFRRANGQEGIVKGGHVFW